jgi:5,10-methenyltetrahydromethanopterin hydrogenase
MAASLDDILTTQKNGVVAVNALTTALAEFKTIYENFVGKDTSVNITSPTLVSSTSGRVVSVVVTVAGAAGAIYDVASVGSAAASNRLFTIPAVTGVYQLNIPVFNGIVVSPGTGQAVTIVYS